MTLKAGEVLFIPAGTVHEAKNIGSGNAAELVRYIVENNRKPFQRNFARASGPCANSTKERAAPVTAHSAAGVIDL